jgi:zinc transporter 1
VLVPKQKYVNLNENTYVFKLLNFFFFSVGNTTNSVALVADSFHMLSDVIAIIIAYISVR